MCLKMDRSNSINYSNIYSWKWKKRNRPDTDQLKRCRSDIAGSADRSIFIILDAEGQEKRRKTAKQDSKKKEGEEVFSGEFSRNGKQHMSNWVSLVTHTATLTKPYNLARTRLDCPLPQVSPFRSSFKDRVSGLFTVLRN